MDDLLPGLAVELHDAGAPLVANLDDRHVEVFGHVVCQEHLDEPDPGLRTLQPSRELLAATVRRRVRALPNVEVRDGCEVRAPVFSRDQWGEERVVGVALVPTAGGPEEALSADLVVDASGAGSRAAAWLRDGGFPSPATHEVKLRMWYTTQWLRMRPDPRLKRMYSVGLRIDRPVGLILLAHEDGRSVFSVVGMGAHACPPDRASMADAVGGFAPREVLDALPAAMELSEPFTHDFPASRRSHYEDLESHPAGFVVIGDAVCTLNPFHGMGMTVAAREAIALREALEAGDDAVATTYYRAVARIVDAAWQPWTGTDMAMPEVEGELTTPMRFGNAWVDKVLQVAAIDETVAVDLLRVVGMVDRPSALLGPRTAGRVVRPRRPVEDESWPRQPLG
jgi:2-polyprenyl-6-methoxyphenol hydroxylase-like FAD-dependent oxidoreductase